MSLDAETVARNVERRADVVESLGDHELGNTMREGAALLREVAEDYRRKFGETC